MTTTERWVVFLQSRNWNMAPIARKFSRAEKAARQARYDLRVQELPVVPGVRSASPARAVADHLGGPAQVIGEIVPGLALAALTNGQFSMIDIVEYVLREIGPADLALSTWTTGINDERQAAAFYRNGLVRSARFMVDPLMFDRRPEVVGPMVEAFGVSAFRAVNTHAKFAVMSNERFAVTVRGSMNLNKNARLENFDLSESREVAALYLAIVDAAFSRSFTEGVQRSAALFQGLMAGGFVPAAPPAESWADTFGDLGELGPVGEIE